MSVGGTPYGPCGPVGNEQAICDCLGCSLDRIAAANEAIARILDERLNKICDNVDQCIDKIIEALKKKIEGPLYAPEECKRMLASGLGGTLEYAVRCANQLREEEEVICSLGDPTTEGKKCKNCGQEPCCCKQGVCVPCPRDKFIGWCNPETGIVIVTKAGEAGPGPPFIQVALSDNEAQAYRDALAYCQKEEKPPEEKPPPSRQLPGPVTIPPIPSSASLSCYIDDYINGRIRSDVTRFAGGAGAWKAMAAIQEDALNVGFAGIDLGLVSDVIFGATRMLGVRDSLVSEQYINVMGQLLGCVSSTFLDAAKVRSAIGQVQQLTGTDFSELTLPWRYAMNVDCRQKQLDPDKAIAAYLANSITDKQLDAYWAIDGFCNPALNQYLQATRSKPVPLQLAFLRRRELIDEKQYDTGMRELGFLEPETRDNLFKLTEVVPTYSDLLRMMVRDVADEGLVSQFGMDEGFPNPKYPQGSQLRKWAEYQGIPEKVMQYFWRAHWAIPSPGQLFTFYHRLRYKPEFGTPEEQRKQIVDALKQQDILPFWIDKYLAVSFRPMRLRDIQRGFQIGSVEDKDLTPLYLDLGYSDETADKMARFTRRLRDSAVVKSDHVKRWTRLQISRQEAVSNLESDNVPREIIEKALRQAEPDFVKSPYATAFVRGDISRDDFARLLNDAGVHLDSIQRIVEILSLRKRNHSALADYQDGLISDSEAIQQLVNDGFSTEVASRRVAEITRAIQREFVVTCQKGIKRRYLLGEIDGQDAHSELVNRGTHTQYASKLIDWWHCELKSGERDVSAKTLCEWLARGSINAADFTRRLIKIGYSQPDASLMLEDCLISVNAKRLADAKKEAKEQSREQERAARAIQKANRAIQAEASRIQRAREQAAATRARRQKQLMSAAEKVNKTCQCGMNEAWNATRSESSRIQREYGLTVDEALQVVLLAADEFAAGELGEFASVVDTYAKQLVAASLDGKPAAIQLTNGSLKS